MSASMDRVDAVLTPTIHPCRDYFCGDDLYDFFDGYYFGIIFVVLMLAVHILVIWIDGYARKYRKVCNEKNQEYSRKVVQVIMSKIEILQNNHMDACE